MGAVAVSPANVVTSNLDSMSTPELGEAIYVSMFAYVPSYVPLVLRGSEVGMGVVPGGVVLRDEFRVRFSDRRFAQLFPFVEDLFPGPRGLFVKWLEIAGDVVAGDDVRIAKG